MRSPHPLPALQGLAAIDVARRLSKKEGLVFFDSSGNFPKNSERIHSIIAAAPSAIYRGSIHCPSDRETLRACLERNAAISKDWAFPLGGLCGWIAYDGAFVFGEYPQMLIKDEQTGDWWETGSLSEKFEDIELSPVKIGDFQAQMPRKDFLNAVKIAKEYIAAGDIYQVNLTQSFSASLVGDSLFDLYQELRQASPAPMAAWISLDQKELLCSSPELFLKISRSQIETRPIKGTRPRFADHEEDQQSAAELRNSEKEVAELIMITDLLRNDLGQVCEFGSVQVTEMLQLESLEQVHHLVSTVSGTLFPSEDALSALAACFPGGSITGAPKKRAMEIIDELEASPRGIYCGCIGWLGFNGESQFNIAIRTLIREDSKLHYHVGAGIVADSSAEAEYLETLQKAQGIRLGLERYLKKPSKD